MLIVCSCSLGLKFHPPKAQRGTVQREESGIGGPVAFFVGDQKGAGLICPPEAGYLGQPTGGEPSQRG